MRKNRNTRFWTTLTAILAFVMAFNASERIIQAQNADLGTETVNQAQNADSNSTDSNNADLNLARGAARSDFLNQVRTQLQNAQSDYVTIKRNIRDTNDKITEIGEQVMTLEQQVQNMDEQINNTQDLIKNVHWQINDKENRIRVLNEDIQIKKVEIESQRRMLLEYVKILYQQDRAVLNIDDSVNVAKLLLSDKPVGDILQEMRYFKVLKETGNNIYEKLQSLVLQQQNDENEIENARNKLQMLQRQLQEEQSNLEVQRQGKAQLLEQTKGQKDIYEQLLKESQEQEAQTLKDMQSLRDNLAFIQKKVNELGDKFNPKDYQSILGRETTSVYDYIRKTSNEEGFYPLWPVSPSRGISAYFHDAGYAKVMGMVHQAIDIPILQGTALRAPADGVVYKTRDNGFGYSYIILAHAGGFMSLYGHVSDIRVKEGQVVMRGETIGLSGGTPGTKGAGAMTTGAHLHFELFKGGKHVDPLDFLPLSYLPLDTLPEKYLSRITGDQEKVQRTAPQINGPTGLSLDQGYNEGPLVPVIPASEAAR